MRNSILFIFLLFPFISFAQKELSPENLDLNRKGKTLDAIRKIAFKDAHTGFYWNDADNATLKWRPQGTVGIKAGNKKMLLVSWYGRKEANYGNRGSRISFVDVTSMSSIKYRHVLLVDKDMNTYPDMHAGGLAVLDGKLHVPDSRGANDEIKVYNLSKIIEVENPDKFYNYKYVLVEESSYKVDINPSFLSYDPSTGLFIVGSFSQAKDYTDKNKLMWYSYVDGKAVVKGTTTFVKEMQGAICKDGVLWVTCSFGKVARSRLHVMNYTLGSDKTVSLTNKKMRDYPPGLEDIYLSSGGNLWLLTEFGPKELITNARVTFAMKANKFKP